MSSDEAEALPSVFVEHADVAVSLDEAPSLLSSAEVGSSDGAALTEHAPEAAEAEDATSSAKPGVFGDAAGENGTICGDALLEPGPIEHDDAMKQDDGAQLEDEVGGGTGYTPKQSKEMIRVIAKHLVSERKTADGVLEDMYQRLKTSQEHKSKGKAESKKGAWKKAD